jgi:hypothetical protein
MAASAFATAFREREQRDQAWIRGAREIEANTTAIAQHYLDSLRSRHLAVHHFGASRSTRADLHRHEARRSGYLGAS